MCHRCDGDIDTRRDKPPASLRGLISVHSDKRRTRARAGHAGQDEFATNIEFVGRNQVKLLW